MRFVEAVAASAILAASNPAHAAQDSGLSFGSGQSSLASRGFGARASVTVRFGDRRTVRASEKMVLSIAAGPVLGLRGGQSSLREREHISPVFGLNIRPGHAASLNLAGQPLATRYTRLGAAEEDKKQDTGDKIAWVALVAGGVMVALVGYVVIRCNGGACSD